MRVCDSHCHLDFSEFDQDREVVLAACRRQGVAAIVVPGVSAAGWPGLVDLCARDPLLHPALGLHPMFLHQHQTGDLERLDQWVRRQRPVAVGEIGLDFYLRETDRARQQDLFLAQLEIARSHALPVILHVRKAHDEVLACLRRVPVAGGIVHAFSGSRQQAEHYIELGFAVGFGGVLTYPNARRVRQLARELPLASIVLETDAPDMAPAGRHGERNSPLNVLLVLDELARIREEDRAQIAQITTQNVEKLLNIVTEVGY
ncbi:MAG: TatD family hydrolase [Pseudomonadota bacterium]